MAHFPTDLSQILTLGAADAVMCSTEGTHTPAVNFKLGFG